MSEDDQIRRLLAEAQHTEPIPPDVAGRMDGVIADLRADRPVRPTVTDLGAARRRRHARTLLIAAAVVIVTGIGIDQLRGLSLGSADDSAGGSGADSGVAAESDAGGGRQDDQDGVRSAEAPAQDYLARAVRIEPDRFAEQVARLQDHRHLADTPVSGAAVAVPKSAECPPPGRGRVVGVRYAGSPGVLVYRPAHGDTQVVDLILCGRPGTYRSITLPVP